MRIGNKVFNNHSSYPFFWSHTHTPTRGLRKKAWVGIKSIPLTFHLRYKGGLFTLFRPQSMLTKKNTVNVLFLFSITESHGIILVGFVWPRYNSAKCIVAVFEFIVQYLSLWSLIHKYLSMCLKEFIAIFNLIS